MHKKYLEELRNKITHDLDRGTILHNRFRMIMLHDTAFYGLREELVHSLGVKTARGLFKRMGFASGCHDAEVALQERENLTDLELFSLGPELHAIEGLVVVEPLEMEIDINKGYIKGSFLWKNSYEAEVSLKANGVADEPTCWMQLGYAMGFCSTLVNDFIYFKETTCSGAGDDVCTIVGKPLSEWDENEVNLADFETHCISDQINWLQTRLDNINTENFSFSFNEIIGNSALIKESIEMVDRVAPTAASVMVLGETGVGKELVARRLHSKSQRSNAPLISINCSALPEGLIESELFGVEKGAYTGATSTRIGKFERAHNGTIFLDEIAELSPNAQAKLLRVIQEGEVERLGGSVPISIDVRIIAATHKNLLELVEQKLFREDLYYRLMTIPLVIPPLRERKSDIHPLSELFLRHYRVKYHKPGIRLTDSAMKLLEQQSWPGNIRELKNIIERLVILSGNDDITMQEVQ